MKFLLILMALIPLISSSADFISPSEISKGIKGYCVTVFSGTKTDTFDVEVLDVVRNFNGDNDMILVRCIGANIEASGVAMGMSGSPVYFDNRLAGSLSFTWSYLKEPVAGITPIEDMIRMSSYDGSIEPSSYQFKEIAVPIVLSGVSSEALNMLEKEISLPFNSRLISGTAEGSVNEKSDITPGKGVAVKLVEGDMTASAIGTCTYVSGDTIFAFGHPLFQKGIVDYPISEAYIYTVMPKTDISFKMGRPFADQFGSIRQDRATGILAVKNEITQMIPVRFNINGKIYNLGFIQDEDLLSSILPMMFVSAVTNQYNSAGPLTVDFSMKLYSRSGNIQYDNMVSSESGAFMIYLDMMSLLTAYLKNIFVSTKTDSVIINAEVSEKLNVLGIEDVVLSGNYYKPGDKIEGEIILSQLRGSRIIQPFSIDIPENASGDSLMLMIINGRDEPIFEIGRSEGRYNFNSIEELKNIIASLKPANSIVIKLMEFSGGTIDKNKEYVKMTGTMTSQMLRLGMQPVNAGILNEKNLQTNGVISGQKPRIIHIRR